ncbi:MAG TPA: hypothetical protein P5531_03790 [Bacteroidales bacterium]|nr:hypothetical protein [Bacteroidales bacterium]
MLIATIEELEQEAMQLQAYLETTMSEQAEEALIRGNDLSAWVARTGKMKADAKYRLNEALQTGLIKQLVEASKAIPNISTKAVNAIVDSACRREHHLYDMIERLNRTATHQLDWCRSVLATAREDRRAQVGINQGRYGQ